MRPSSIGNIEAPKKEEKGRAVKRRSEIPAMCFFGKPGYALSFVRVTSFIGYKRKKNQWGAIKRVKQQEWKA